MLSLDAARAEILDRAAGLSYYFSFALFPTLLFLTALLGLLPFPDAMSRLLGYADRGSPRDYERAGATWWLENVHDRRGSLMEMLALIERGPGA